MKTIKLRDNMSGKELYIEFDLDSKKMIVSMIVNGVKVDRVPELESNDGINVYGSEGELFHLDDSQLKQMREL